MTGVPTFPDPGTGDSLTIRPATKDDIPNVVALDADVTGLAKPEYWRDMFANYQTVHGGSELFLIADNAGVLEGFIIGEIREWEFGSPPVGWIFAVQVRPGQRVRGLGTQLFEAICARFREARVGHVRTMVARDNIPIHAFFRSQGMVAGPFLELEKRLA